jgi:NAD(P)H-dependent flavin oxidoreductase YrpB (nitropropane dioxygenase family)
MTTAVPPTANPFTRLTGARLPIQSAPMAGVVRDAALPAAVAAGSHGMFLQAPTSSA